MTQAGRRWIVMAKEMEVEAIEVKFFDDLTAEELEEFEAHGYLVAQEDDVTCTTDSGDTVHVNRRKILVITDYDDLQAE